jgi:hypothetical protein
MIIAEVNQIWAEWKKLSKYFKCKVCLNDMFELVPNRHPVYPAFELNPIKYVMGDLFLMYCKHCDKFTTTVHRDDFEATNGCHVLTESAA